MEFLATFFSDPSHGAVLIACAITLSAFVLEDITTVFVGILAAEGFVGVPLALTALYTGIILGDAALYTLGAVARTHPKLAHYIDHDHTSSFKVWLESRYRVIVFAGHFVPGLRFTTYVASGFFRRPLNVFVPTALAGGLTLGTGLFTLAYWFGSVTTTWMRPVRYVTAALFVLVLFLISRQNFQTLRAKKNTPDTAADTRAP